MVSVIHKYTMTNTEEYNDLVAKNNKVQDEIKILKDEIKRFDDDFEYEDEYEKEEMLEVFARMKEEKNDVLKYKEDELDYIQGEIRLIEFDMDDL